MKTYFAGSIRGGRQDALLYAQLIDLLKRYGDVLTEHVGEPELKEENLTDREIYERDMRWLREADVVVAEVTVPSHGVGYEIARAETLGKPVLCLHRPQAGHHLSALLAGNPSIHCETYRQLSQVDAILEAFFGKQPTQRDGWA
jgi:nucleoside 2-deoxyribosyltransferase